MERLLKQIGTFMSDIADEFKIVVVEAIRSLCLKFPQKYRALMNFLSNVRAYPPRLCSSMVLPTTAVPSAERRPHKQLSNSLRRRTMLCMQHPTRRSGLVHAGRV